MNKEELLRKARMFDHEETEEGTQHETLFEKALKARHEWKSKNSVKYNEEDLELVEGWLKNIIGGEQIMKVKGFPKNSKSRLTLFIIGVMKKFYLEGKVKIMK